MVLAELVHEEVIRQQQVRAEEVIKFLSKIKHPSTNRLTLLGQWMGAFLQYTESLREENCVIQVSADNLEGPEYLLTETDSVSIHGIVVPCNFKELLAADPETQCRHLITAVTIAHRKQTDGATPYTQADSDSINASINQRLAEFDSYLRSQQRYGRDLSLVG